MYDCVISADVTGMVEYWRPDEPYELPNGIPGLWSFKSSTDLFDFKKSKSVPCTITLSPDGSKFSTTSLPDRQVRIFNFASGKLSRKYDESIRAITEMQQAGTAIVKLDEMEFGRRLAVERELNTTAGVPPEVEAGKAGSLRLFEGGAQHAAGLANANALFDESGNFLIYASMLGIKSECERAELRNGR